MLLQVAYMEKLFALQGESMRDVAPSYGKCSLLTAFIDTHYCYHQWGTFAICLDMFMQRHSAWPR